MATTATNATATTMLPAATSAAAMTTVSAAMTSHKGHRPKMIITASVSRCLSLSREAELCSAKPRYGLTVTVSLARWSVPVIPFALVNSMLPRFCAHLTTFLPSGALVIVIAPAPGTRTGVVSSIKG